MSDLQTYNYTDWLIGKSKLLLLTGISGAGKSTLSEELVSKVSSIALINFDVFLYDDPDKYKNYEIADAFFLKYPSLLHFRNQVTYGDANYYNYICTCIDFVVAEYVEKQGLQVIFDGTIFRKQDILDFTIERYGTLPSIIIANIGTVRATFRVFKRGSSRRPYLTKFGKFKFFCRIFRRNYCKNVKRKAELDKIKIYIGSLYNVESLYSLCKRLDNNN